MQPSLWWNTEKNCLSVIDQRSLPHKLSVEHIYTAHHAAVAIKDMTVRGAPLIGVTAAYSFYLAALEASPQFFREELQRAYNDLLSTRPTAVNLKWALDAMMKNIEGETDLGLIRKKSFYEAEKIRNDDIEMCRKIGEHGLSLIETVSRAKNGGAVNILTHCNAGRLACVQWGTATSPVYHAHQKGIKVHVWVDETRPRNQGAALTAYELNEAGIPHTLIADNAGGLLMQKGMVDLVITGADRVAANGDAANKIGTYLKALAAKDNDIPFYIAFPFSTADLSIASGKEIAIEERSEEEVKFVQGKHGEEILEVLICPENTRALNYGFDVTPAHLISMFITDRGLIAPHELKSFIAK